MSWRDAIQKNRRDIMAMTTPEMSAIMDVLVEARERTAKALADFIKKNQGSEYQLHTHRSLIVQLDSVLKMIEKELPKDVVKDLKREGKLAIKKGAENTARLVREGEKKFRGAVNTLRIPIAKVLTNVDRTLIGRYETRASRYAGRVGDRIRRELAIGVVRGESVDQMASRLLGEMKYERIKGRPSKVADAIADRDFFRNKADAERLVRTELANAYTEAQLESLAEADEEDPGWKKRWDAANDMRVCAICADMDGRVVGLHENFKGGVQGPPIHPNDRCCIVPYRDEWGSQALPGTGSPQRASRR